MVQKTEVLQRAVPEEFVTQRKSLPKAPTFAPVDLEPFPKAEAALLVKELDRTWTQSTTGTLSVARSHIKLRKLQENFAKARTALAEFAGLLCDSKEVADLQRALDDDTRPEGVAALAKTSELIEGTAAAASALEKELKLALLLHADSLARHVKAARAHVQAKLSVSVRQQESSSQSAPLISSQEREAQLHEIDIDRRISTCIQSSRVGSGTGGGNGTGDNRPKAQRRPQSQQA